MAAASSRRLLNLPQSLFARPAGVVSINLIGSRLVNRQIDGSLRWRVVVEMEAYSQSDLATRWFFACLSCGQWAPSWQQEISMASDAGLPLGSG